MIEGAQIRTLECGPLAFTAYEMGAGPLVLCLHGFPDTPYTFRHLLPQLAQAGYRAVAVTMRGYEPSSQPADGNYRGIALAQDVSDWIEALGETSAHVIGHDWGSAAGQLAAVKNSAVIRSLVAMAVPHTGRFSAGMRADRAQFAKSWYMLFFQMRGVSDFVVQWNRRAFLGMLWQQWSPGFVPPREDLAYVKFMFSKPGVQKAALSYYRCAFDGSAANEESLRLSAGRIPVPTLGLSGADDGCILAATFEREMRTEDFPAGLEVARIEGAGHFLHLERPDEVGGKILDWLARH